MARRTGVSRRRRLMLAVGTLGVLVTACTSSTTNASSDHADAPHAIGLRMETLIDRSRPTPANGTTPARSRRILVTTILYPAAGTPGSPPVTDATPDRSDGPYPLIVFAHGFGSDVTDYLPLLEKWAAAGFEVAAPLFPLTNSTTPGEPTSPTTSTSRET